MPFSETLGLLCCYAHVVHVLSGMRAWRRRKLKKSYEYEVRWAGAFSHPEHDTWLTRDQCAPARLPCPGLACK